MARLNHIVVALTLLSARALIAPLSPARGAVLRATGVAELYTSSGVGKAAAPAKAAAAAAGVPDLYSSSGVSGAGKAVPVAKAAPKPAVAAPKPAPAPAPVEAPKAAAPAAPAVDAADDVAAVVVGGGRIGSLLLGDGDALMTSSSGWPADAPKSGPIYVCTRNDALDSVIDTVPADRRSDLVFLQNGWLGPYLEGKDLAAASQCLVFFAVATLDAAPIDGVTDLNPEGLTTATGKWAGALTARLAARGLRCRAADGDAFSVAMLEKHVWICAFMMVGATHGGITVGEVEAKHAAEVDALIVELLGAGAADLGVEVDGATAPDRLRAYARAVAHFPTAVKEFPWRNGYFYKLSYDAGLAGAADPCPTHTQLLYDLGLPLPVSWLWA